MFQVSDPVYITKCGSYTPEEAERALREQFAALGLLSGAAAGEKGGHQTESGDENAAGGRRNDPPAACEDGGKACGGAGCVGDAGGKPGGLYSETALRMVYRGCGMEEAAKEGNFTLNYDLSAREVPFPEGVQTKMFHLITPALDCDLLLNFSKLKTHGLTGMSAAVKNLFGTVPGTEKLEMHARFTEEDDFENMLLDLCIFHHKNTEVIDFCDAVVGMEGNGPTGGSRESWACCLRPGIPAILTLRRQGSSDFWERFRCCGRRRHGATARRSRSSSRYSATGRERSLFPLKRRTASGRAACNGFSPSAAADSNV